MLIMSQINHIKDLSNCGYRVSEIAKETGTDPKTIRKYLSQEDFSPTPPLLVFDNATGVGRRVGDSIHESELFSRFRAHYHFRVGKVLAKLADNRKLEI